MRRNGPVIAVTGRLPGFRSGSLAALALWMASGAAAAGDYYLRAGIGLDRPGEAAFTDKDCSSTVPAALYGCGSGRAGAPSVRYPVTA